MNAEMKSKICKDAEAKLAEAMLAMYQHTHTHTHLGLQQSEVSEPVRGLWLDVAPEHAGQKRCLSPLIK